MIQTLLFQGEMDLCYRVHLNTSVLPQFPSVHMMFCGVEMSVSREKLLDRVSGMTRERWDILFDIWELSFVGSGGVCDWASSEHVGGIRSRELQSGTGGF